jgi:hypothetical protein
MSLFGCSAAPRPNPSASRGPIRSNPPGYRQRLQRAAELVDRSNDLFRVDGVTISPYGPCWPGFTLMPDPYLAPYGQPTRGRTMVTSEKVEQAIRFCHDQRVRLNIVASGLAELDSHLNQLEALGEAPLTANGRAWTLQHFYFAPADPVRRFAALGFDVTTSMSFSWGKSELVRGTVRRAPAGRLHSARPAPPGRSPRRGAHRLGTRQRLRTDRLGRPAVLRGQRAAGRDPGHQPPTGPRHVDPRRRPRPVLGRHRIHRAWQPCRPCRRRPRSADVLAGGPARHSRRLHDARWTHRRRPRSYDWQAGRHWRRRQPAALTSVWLHRTPRHRRPGTLRESSQVRRNPADGPGSTTVR